VAFTGVSQRVSQSLHELPNHSISATLPRLDAVVARQTAVDVASEVRAGIAKAAQSAVQGIANAAAAEAMQAAAIAAKVIKPPIEE
jgi:hypothetical protein